MSFQEAAPSTRVCMFPPLKLEVGWMSPRVTVPQPVGGGWTGLLFYLPPAKCRVGGQHQGQRNGVILSAGRPAASLASLAWERSEPVSQISRSNGLAGHEHESFKPPNHKGRNSAQELGVWMETRPSYFLNFSQISQEPAVKCAAFYPDS